MKFLRFIFRSSLRNKRRGALTVLSVALSVFLIALLLAILAGFDRGSEFGQGRLRLVVRNAVSLQVPLPERLRDELATIPHVKLVYSHDWFGGIYKDTRPENFFAQFACDARLLTKMFDELKFAPGDDDAFVANRTGCVVGRGLANRYGWKKGDRVALKGTIYPFNPDLTIEGVFESEEFADALFFQRAYLEEGTGNRGQVGVFWLRVDAPANMAAVAEAVDAKYRNSPHETKTETEQAFRLSFVEMIGNIQLLIRNIGIAVLFTIVLIAGNTMALSARERMVEVAVLRAIGFPRGTIVGLILGESLLLSAAGGLLGAGLASSVVSHFAKSATGFMFFLRQMTLSPAGLATAVGLAVGVGLAAGLVPAWRAGQVSIVDGLRKVA